MVLLRLCFSHFCYTDQSDSQMVAHIFWAPTLGDVSSGLLHHFTKETPQSSPRFTSWNLLLHYHRLVELSSRETGILEKPGRSDPEPDRRETQIRWSQMGPENQVIFLCHRPTSPTSGLLIGEQSFFLRLLVLPQTEQEEWQDIKAQIRKPSILSKSWENGVDKAIESNIPPCSL